MTTQLTRRAAFRLAGGAAVAALALGSTVAPASAALEPARITARVTDAMPASGQTFRVYGTLTRDGRPIADRRVRVQTWRNGAWQDLSGASMLTSSTGTYALRLTLSQRGERTLRVVGTVYGADPRARFTVTVY